MLENTITPNTTALTGSSRIRTRERFSKNSITAFKVYFLKNKYEKNHLERNKYLWEKFQLLSFSHISVSESITENRTLWFSPHYIDKIMVRVHLCNISYAYMARASIVIVLGFRETTTIRAV